MDTEHFFPEHVTARETGLPRPWLSTKAKAGELPHLKIGRRRFYDLNAVRAALATMTLGGIKADSIVGECGSDKPVECKGASRAK